MPDTTTETKTCGYCGGILFYSTEDTWLHDASSACNGSLCPDCGEPTYYTDAQGWTHQNPDATCFLA